MSVTDCPECGGENAIEAVLRIELDDVVLEEIGNGGWARYRVADFVPAASADNPDNGIVTGDDDCVRVGCRDCGETFEDVVIPVRVSTRWTYSPDAR